MARYAIRAAIGQLYDYRHKAKADPSLLIILGSEPTDANDKDLALSNGFGLAWRQSSKNFTMTWP